MGRGGGECGEGVKQGGRGRERRVERGSEVGGGGEGGWAREGEEEDR